MTNPTQGRLPDFVIIGARKSGTTTLFEWLGAQDGVWLPEVKEPAFFSRVEHWNKGLGWYTGLFEGAPHDALVGEASGSYTSHEFAEQAAERMVSVVPDARLIYVIRDPVERMKSQYRHQVQRARETDPFPIATRTPGNSYVGHSLYHARLLPYIERFTRHQILVVKAEDLFEGQVDVWNEITEFLGLPATTPPMGVHNATADKVQFTRILDAIERRGVLSRINRVPQPIRSIGRRLLTRGQPVLDLGEVSNEVKALLVEDTRALEAWLGRSSPLWG